MRVPSERFLTLLIGVCVLFCLFFFALHNLIKRYQRVYRYVLYKHTYETLSHYQVKERKREAGALFQRN